MSTLAKVVAHEIPGMLLVIMFILIMESIHAPEIRIAKNGKWLKSKKNPKPKPGEPGAIFYALHDDPDECHYRLSTILKGISLTLQFEAFTRWDSIPKNTMELVGTFMPMYIEQWMRSFPRSEGRKHKIIKLHLSLHCPMDCKRWGPMCNFSGACLEHGHITFAKNSSKQTQKRKDTLPSQCLHRVIENNQIHKAYHELPIHDVEGSRARFSPPKKDHPPIYSKLRFASIGTDGIRWLGTKASKNRTFRGALPMDTAIKFFQDYVLPQIVEDRVGLLVETTRNSIKFKANPSYGAGGAANQHWATINYEGHGEVPAHLLCFFELRSDPINPITFNGCCIEKQGYYALVHVLPCSLNIKGEGCRMELAHADQRLIYRCQKWDKDKHGDNPEWNRIVDGTVTPTLQVVSCDTIESPLIAIPDFYLQSPDRHIYYLIAPHQSWAPDLVAFMEEEIALEEAQLKAVHDTNGNKKGKEQMQEDTAKLKKLRRDRALYRCKPHK